MTFHQRTLIVIFFVCFLDTVRLKVFPIDNIYIKNVAQDYELIPCIPSFPEVNVTIEATDIVKTTMPYLFLDPVNIH